MNKLKTFFSKNKKLDTEQNIESITMPNSSSQPKFTNDNIDMQKSKEKEQNSNNDNSIPTANVTYPTIDDQDINGSDNNHVQINVDVDHQSYETGSYSSDTNVSLLSSDLESSYSHDDSSLKSNKIFSEQIELTDYKLLEKIGEGAFSKVFQAISLGTSHVSRSYKYVAIKVIKKDILNKEDADQLGVHGKKKGSSKSSTREQVLKEVALHKKISPGCKNTVHFIEFKETDSYYYIVQELLNGGEIFNEIVKLTYFSEDLSRHVVRQLGNAIKHLHSMGIVHRDIKPENLLFNPIEYTPSPQPKFRKSDDPNSKVDEGVFIPGVGGGGIGIVKLADFGLSKQIFETNTKTPCGTVGYTAPEVVRDETYSMKVDMWGIGCVLYTMLCGFPPFYDEKINGLTEKISRGEYTFLKPWWDEISDGAKSCVRRLLEVDPAKRYDIDELLNDPWLNQYDCEVNKVAALEESNHKKKRSKAHKKRMMFNQFADSSVLYSPAAVAMRDAFDISNAVARIEDERKQVPAFGLTSLMEDNEMNSFDEGELQERAMMYDSQHQLELDDMMFHLKLDSSAIVKRRKQKKNTIP